MFYYCLLQAPVVQRVDNAISIQTKHYPMDSAIRVNWPLTGCPSQKTVASRPHPPEPPPPPPPNPFLPYCLGNDREIKKQMKLLEMKKVNERIHIPRERNVWLSKLMALDNTWNNFSIGATHKINLLFNSRWISSIITKLFFSKVDPLNQSRKYIESILMNIIYTNSSRLLLVNVIYTVTIKNSSQTF